MSDEEVKSVVKSAEGIFNEYKEIASTVWDGLTSIIVEPEILEEPKKRDIGSASELSDQASIEINNLCKLANDLPHKLEADFGISAAKKNQLYNKLIGQKLGDVINDDGTFNIEYLKKIGVEEDILTSLNGYYLTKINDSLKEMKFAEIKRSDSGYDAVVLERADGGYNIISSWTDDKSGGDLSSIVYVLMEYLYGKELSESITPFMPLIMPQLENFDSGLNPEEAYNNQVEDCTTLIEKYTIEAKQNNSTVELFGCSLGGGITSTAYGAFKINNEEMSDYISAVTVYNPFLLHMNSYDEGVVADHGWNRFKSDFFDLSWENLWEFVVGRGLGGYIWINGLKASKALTSEDLIKTLKDDEKFRLYSAESDVVSTLNPYLDDLGDRIVYIPTAPLEESDVVPVPEIKCSFSDILDMINAKKQIGEQEVKQVIDNISILYDYIIMGKGRHGLSWDKDCFDANGNLIKEGEYQNINEILATITNVEYDGNSSKLDLKYLTTLLFCQLIPVQSASGFLGLRDMINYLIKNPGNYNHEEFMNVVATSLVESINSLPVSTFLNYAASKSESNSFAMLVQVLYGDSILSDERTRSVLIESLTEILKNPDNFSITMEISKMFAQNNTESAITVLMNDLIEGGDTLKLAEKLTPVVCDILEEFFRTDNGKKMVLDKIGYERYKVYAIDEFELAANLVGEISQILEEDLEDNNGKIFKTMINIINEDKNSFVIGKIIYYIDLAGNKYIDSLSGYGYYKYPILDLVSSLI